MTYTSACYGLPQQTNLTDFDPRLVSQAGVVIACSPAEALLRAKVALALRARTLWIQVRQTCLSLPPPDPRLAAARIYERGAELGEHTIFRCTQQGDLSSRPPRQGPRSSSPGPTMVHDTRPRSLRKKAASHELMSSDALWRGRYQAAGALAWATALCSKAATGGDMLIRWAAWTACGETLRSVLDRGFWSVTTPHTSACLRGHT